MRLSLTFLAEFGILFANRFSVPCSRFRIIRYTGAVAQLGERVNGIHEVRGSIPLSSTKARRRRAFEFRSQRSDI
jgi:isopenicillin N synthase-like dioxygenase